MGRAARRRAGALFGLSALLGGVVVLGLGGSSASAGVSCPGGTIVVNSTADTATPGTLRTAFTTANTDNGGTICVDTTAVTSPIELTSGISLPSYTGSGNLTVDGNGATVNANLHGEHLEDETSSSTFTVNDLTIENAIGAPDTNGGCIAASGPVVVTGSTLTHCSGLGSGAYTTGSSLTVTDSVVTDGFDGGPGVGALGSVTITNSTLTGTDSAFPGGGIGSGGAVTVTNSTIGTNQSAGGGGGIDATGAVTVMNSTVSGNTTDSGGSGGGISGSSVTVTNSTVSGNTASENGGGFSGGATTVTNSTISGNTSTGGSGGGFYTFGGAATVTDSTVSGNTSTAGSGGGFSGEVATVTGSTVSGNTASGGGGGGFHTFGGAATVTDSTVSGNTSTRDSGGGILVFGAATLVYATVASNTAPTGANLDSSGALTSFGSVIASPQGGGTNCAGLPADSTISHGFNLEDDAGASCQFSTATQDLVPGTAANLGPLANNDASTLTMLPQPGSPLINAIPFASCQADGASGITTDQRGLPRPSPPDGACDVGAVEVQVVPATPLVITPTFTG